MARSLVRVGRARCDLFPSDCKLIQFGVIHRMNHSLMFVQFRTVALEWYLLEMFKVHPKEMMEMNPGLS